jgi:CRISPR-associated endoribonuclease Cas6
MRFKLDFSIQGTHPHILPANYHIDFSSWIHKMLHFENKEFAEWLKTKGYSDPQGEYKIYTFSEFNFEQVKHQDDRLIIEGEKASLNLSFYAHEEIENFIPDIFIGKEFKIGDSISKVGFKVESLQRLPDPAFGYEIMKFSCISPMLITEPGKTDGVYLSPDQKGFDKVFFKNLMFKYANLVKFMPENSNGLTNLQDLQFKLLKKPKPRIIKIKSDSTHQKTVKGYLFDFSIKAPKALLQIGYFGGFGDLNNQGFGCCEVL